MRTDREPPRPRPRVKPAAAAPADDFLVRYLRRIESRLQHLVHSLETVEKCVVALDDRLTAVERSVATTTGCGAAIVALDARLDALEVSSADVRRRIAPVERRLRDVVAFIADCL